MEFELSNNSYGKSGIEFFICASKTYWLQFEASIEIKGKFAAVFCSGDNASILPTDTFSNHLEDIAAKAIGADPYLIAVDLVERLMSRMESATFGKITISATKWAPLSEGSNAMTPDPKSIHFTATRNQAGDVTLYGHSKTRLIRPSGSSFSRFQRDELTDKKDVDSRIILGSLLAKWRYRLVPADLFTDNIAIEYLISESFGSVPSRSLQENLYKVGEDLLSKRGDIDEISVSFDSLGTEVINKKTTELTSTATGQSRNSESNQLWRGIPTPTGTTYAMINRHEDPLRH